MRASVAVTICIIVLLPTFAHAGVLISEVAWMGTVSDANDEWIELYNNNDTPLDLTGWTLKAVDGQPSIILSGQIGSNAYVILERTNDETVPNVSALVTYSGAMANTGEVLELRDQNGALVDSAQGSDEWSIGGDNATKDTAQRQGEPAVGAWITAPASPMYGVLQASSNGTGEGSTQSSSTKSVVSKSSGGNIIYAKVFKGEVKPSLTPALILDVEEERTVTVGMPTEFTVRTFKEGGKEFVCRDIEWNFGDGSVGKGREVQHTFQYTGDYVVSIQGKREGFLKEVQGSTKMIVHVVEPSVEIVQVNSAYVEMENKSSEVADISNFVIVSGNTHFKIPRNTFVLPKAHIRLPWKTTQIKSTDNVSLFRPDGSFVSTFSNVKEKAKSLVYTQSQGAATKSSPKNVSETLLQETKNILTPQAFTQTAQAYESLDDAKNEGDMKWWWFFALGIVISITILAVILMRREQQEVIEGFLIESDESR